MVIFVICTMFLLLSVSRYDYKVVLVLVQATSFKVALSDVDVL